MLNFIATLLLHGRKSTKSPQKIHGRRLDNNFMKMNPYILFSGLFLASGASLLVYVFADISLGLALAVGVVMVGISWLYTWRRISEEKKKFLLLRIWVGFVAGIAATAAYDVSRFLLIKITGIQFWPFHIFEIFGKAILGQGAEGFWVTPVGVFYHFLNGVTFVISYTIIFGKRGIFYGILWSMMLEVLMVIVYPGWLNIKLINEFLSVSIFGHIVYGVAMGFIARRLLLYYDNKGEKK